MQAPLQGALGQVARIGQRGKCPGARRVCQQVLQRANDWLAQAVRSDNFFHLALFGYDQRLGFVVRPGYLPLACVGGVDVQGLNGTVAFNDGDGIGSAQDTVDITATDLGQKSGQEAAYHQVFWRCRRRSIGGVAANADARIGQALDYRAIVPMGMIPEATPFLEQYPRIRRRKRGGPYRIVSDAIEISAYCENGLRPTACVKLSQQVAFEFGRRASIADWINAASGGSCRVIWWQSRGNQLDQAGFGKFADGRRSFQTLRMTASAEIVK